MPIDWQAAAERAQELEDQGYTPAQVDGIMRRETPGLTPEQAQAQKDMGRAVRELHAESTAGGQEPPKPLGKDIMDAAFAAQGGNRVRPSAGMGKDAVAAGIDRLFSRAVDGDPEAVYKRHDESWSQAKDRWEQRRR